MKEKSKQVAELLRVLANENRLMALCYLMQGPMTAGSISNNIPQISQSALSQHLSLLKAHKILDSEKSGQNVTYKISDDRVKEVINVLKKYYCD